jgi:hypothetical protein
MTRLFHLMILFLPFCTMQAQNSISCASPEASQFDFWVGTWDLTWNDSIHGSNIITKEMGSCVIHENFSDPSTKYIGQSLSVFNPQTKTWQQTWVDNQGAYMSFEGTYEHGKMILSRTITVKGQKTIQRMVFCNIAANAFDWYWEASTTSGTTWKTNWLIHYKRKA